jgi:hypothetical protein
MKLKIIFILVGIIIGGLGGAVGYNIGLDQGAKRNISSFEECAAAGYPIMDSYPEQCATPEGKNFTKNIAGSDQAVTLNGTVVCLLHKNTDGPQTLECAIGLKTDDGKYYSLRSDVPDSALASAAGSDRKVQITGTLKKEPSMMYQSEGIITVSKFEFI